MSLYILDTDHVSLFQRNDSSVVQHLATVASNSGSDAMWMMTLDLRVLSDLGGLAKG
jgi:hypothetical protein